MAKLRENSVAFCNIEMIQSWYSEQLDELFLPFPSVGVHVLKYLITLEVKTCCHQAWTWATEGSRLVDISKGYGISFQLPTYYIYTPINGYMHFHNNSESIVICHVMSGYSTLSP